MESVFRSFCLSVVLFLSTDHITAQEAQDSTSTKERYFKFAPGAAYQQGRDEGMSPLIYRGLHFNGIIGLEKVKNNRFHTMDIEAMFGNMKPPTQPKGMRSSALALRLHLDYSMMQKMKTWQNEKLQLFAGGTWNNMLNVLWHQRYLNNSLNYGLSSSLGVAARLQYAFDFKKKPFRIYANLQLPLLAFNLRPAYASSIPEGYIAQDRSNVRAFFDSGKLQTLNSFFRIRNEIGLIRVLPNSNQVMLAYRWDYYQISHVHRVQMAVHQIMLGWRFQF